MASEAEIKQKYGGNLVDAIVMTKSAINRHWRDDKGNQVSKNIEKTQHLFNEFYKETAKVINKLVEVEEQARKADWSGEPYAHGHGEKLQGGSKHDHISIMYSSADDPTHITSEHDVHDFIDNEGNYMGSDF